MSTYPVEITAAVRSLLAMVSDAARTETPGLPFPSQLLKEKFQWAKSSIACISDYYLPIAYDLFHAFYRYLPDGPWPEAGVQQIDCPNSPALLADFIDELLDDLKRSVRAKLMACAWESGFYPGGHTNMEIAIQLAALEKEQAHVERGVVLFNTTTTHSERALTELRNRHKRLASRLKRRWY